MGNLCKNVRYFCYEVFKRCFNQTLSIYVYCKRLTLVLLRNKITMCHSAPVGKNLLKTEFTTVLIKSIECVIVKKNNPNWWNCVAVHYIFLKASGCIVRLRVGLLRIVSLIFFKTNFYAFYNDFSNW